MMNAAEARAIAQKRRKENVDGFINLILDEVQYLALDGKFDGTVEVEGNCDCELLESKLRELGYAVCIHENSNEIFVEIEWSI